MNIQYLENRLTASKEWTDKKCQWCGRYIENGDKISLLVISSENKYKYKKLSKNYIIHTEELEQLVKETKSGEDLVYKLANRAIPRINQPLSESQKAAANAFRIACKELGFNIETQVGDNLKFRKNGTSAQVILNIRTGRISTTQRARKSVIDGLYEMECVAKIHNIMVEILGVGQINNFKANVVIQKAINEASSLMNK